ncbi:MAG: hypothetical protein QG650_493 [Patescibacteria group bacterium]|nr:hypothetical protein [Patescibacteria group bacterium]
METSDLVGEKAVEMDDIPPRNSSERLFRRPFHGSGNLGSFEFFTTFAVPRQIFAIPLDAFRTLTQFVRVFFRFSIEAGRFFEGFHSAVYVFEGDSCGFPESEFVERKKRETVHFTSLEILFRNPAPFRYGVRSAFHTWDYGTFAAYFQIVVSSRSHICLLTFYEYNPLDYLAFSYRPMSRIDLLRVSDSASPRVAKILRTAVSYKIS